MIKKINNFLDNKMTKNEKIYLFYSLILIPLMFFNFDNLTITGVSRFFGILSLVSLIFGLYLWYQKNHIFNSLPIYFILAGYMCWYGQILIRCLGFLPGQLIQIDYFEPSAFYKTCSFLTVSFNFLFLGIIIFTKKSHYTNDIKNQSLKSINLKKAMTFVGLAMVLGSFFFRYYNIISSIIGVFTDGYMSLYENKVEHSSLYNIYSNFEIFFVPGLIILFFANKENKKLVKIILSIALIDIVLGFVAGARSGALTMLFTFFWMYTYEIKNLKLHHLIIMGILGLILAKLFTVILNFRVMPNKSFASFFDLFFNSEGNAVLSVMNEIGFNVFSLYHTQRLIPTVDSFGLGYTYFASVMAIIPSLFFGGYSFSKKAALPEWLMGRLEMDFGPGYTIVAESYYNFGYLGFIIMFLIGMLIGKIFNNDLKDDKRIVKSCIFAILFYSNVFIVRDTFLMVFRKFIYLVVLPFVAVYIINSILDKKIKIKFGDKIISFINYVCQYVFKLDNKKISKPSNKILLVSDTKGKKSSKINAYIKFLYEQGYVVDVITDTSKIDNGMVSNVHRVDLSKNLMNNLKQVFSVKKILKNKYDKVIICDSKLNYLVRIANTLLNNSIMDVIYIDTSSYKSYDNKIKNTTNNLLQKYLSRFTKTIFVYDKKKYTILIENVHCDINYSEEFNFEQVMYEAKI